jgi:DNA-binding transcriptional MerR regulator
MWIVVQRGKYYSEMEGDIFALLCRQYAEDGKTPPKKVGEAETHFKAKELATKLQEQMREERKNASNSQVGGCAGGRDPEQNVAAPVPEAEAGQRNEARVPGDGSGGGDEVAGGEHVVGEETGPIGLSLLDAQNQGMLPAAWAKEDDVLVGVRGGEDRLPVFTGERYCRAHPREARVMVQLRFVYGFPIREVAKILGASPQTVSNVCRREIDGQTAKSFKEAMASRLRNTVTDLLEQVQERIMNEKAMKETTLKDVVTALEKAGNMLQQMETKDVTDKPKEGSDPQHLADMEQVAQNYLAGLPRVAEVTNNKETP